MEVSSVVAKAYTNPAAQSERSQQSEQARQSRQVEREAQSAQEQVKKNEDVPKPVANAQGQTTGQVINTTA